MMMLLFVQTAVKKWTTTAAKPEGGTVANQFVFNGIDDGIYVLCETKTPDGYNTMDPVKFTVTAAHDIDSPNPTLTSLTSNVDLVTGDFRTGALTGNVKNQKGSTLPSTGGAGTTAFYVIGGVLVAGAAVMLIAKNRFSNTK